MNIMVTVQVDGGPTKAIHVNQREKLISAISRELGLTTKRLKDTYVSKYGKPINIKKSF